MVPYQGLPDSNNCSRRGQWSSPLTRASSSFSEDDSSKASDDDNEPPCLAAVTAAMIVLLAIVGLVLGLSMLHLSNLPPSVEQNETTTQAAYPEPATQDPCVGRDRVLTPTRQKLGAEAHQGPLPGDVEPLHYAITMTLCGKSLDDAGVNVTGRVEALLRPKVPTVKLVLKASSERIKDVTMALLDRSGSTCHEPAALPIESVSASGQFLIVKLENELVAGTAYTLVTEYHYDKTAADGPIHLSPTLGRMELKSGEAHVAFPCFEEHGWLAPIQLTLVVPGKLHAASNTALDWQPVPLGTAFAHKFTTTIPMPVDKLAWAVFAETLIPRDIIPGKVKQYAVAEDTQLKKSVATAFQFLSSFFQAAGSEYVRKLDIVVSASDEQDSLGLVVLKAPVVNKDMCRKVAEQWTRHLLLQPTPPSWLATAGVEYLCRLAVTEEKGMLAAFHEDLKACMKADTPPSVSKYVDSNLFKVSSLEKELDMFNPHVPKEKLEPWLEGGYQVLDVERTYGSKKQIKWNDA
ncbi:hypothetical protein HPB49_009865 [Dermacentor silvarum]|uniref:Uncharacterized protein n=1 Tax=Dermacentor silvarum TaxID=543639 RepID=A0ACB8DC86_DERSI|nr:hypothetical protein HPB49_009865 [Dermacentor silvarum]